MKKLFVCLLLILLISSSTASLTFCQDDEKEPPEGYVDESPPLSDPAPSRSPFQITGGLDVLLIIGAIIVIGYIGLRVYMHYRVE